jgi:uncharacterized membrane protein
MVRLRRPDHPDRGAAAVEFALVLPLLFVILFGVVEYGYNLFQMQSAQATIREAARTVALGIDDCGEVPTIVLRAARNNGLGLAENAIRSGTSLRIEPPPGTQTVPVAPGRGDTAVMTLTYEPTLDFPLIPFPEDITREAGVVVEDVGRLQGRTCDGGTGG